MDYKRYGGEYMSFGRELSDNFQKLTNGIFEDEIVLFTKLQDAFLNLKHYSKYNVAIDIIHGSKSCVEFQHDASYISKPAVGCTFKRELSDLLFVVFSAKKELEIRIMYMQNKRGKSDCKFVADLAQFHLLRERKEIISNPLPECVFGDRKILLDAILPSVGSYGVFYKCRNNITSKVDMAYYPAINLELFTPSGSLKRTVKYPRRRYGIIDNSRGYSESQGESNLENFADALVAMHIGTPILTSVSAHKGVIDFLYNCSSTFRKAYPLDNINEDNIVTTFEKMPITYIINADMISKLDER